MSEHLLEVKDLKVSFDTYAGEVQAVRGVSFHLDKNETLAIVGESGCGKSVTVQTLMRLNPEPPSRIKQGSILYKGEELVGKTDKQMRDYRGKEFAMVFQDAMTSLNPVSRVGSQIVEAIRVHERDVSREDAKKRAIEMLGKVGLPNPEQVFRRYPHTMSGGQRQRAMIAMALACNPSVLIADEPTTALDVTTQAQILDLMKDIQAETGCGIILITHNLGVVARMADRVAVMYAGKIVEEGQLDDVFYRPKHPYTWGLLESMPDLRDRSADRLASIPGAPPDLFAPPTGCGFMARCPYCMEVCTKHDPARTCVAGDHATRCWLQDERAPKVEPPMGDEKFLRASDASSPNAATVTEGGEADV
jgi:oligopeptide transport system ATP-binding protein